MGHALARFNSSSAAGSRCKLAPATSVSSCPSVVALAIGAVTLGRARSQARETAAGVESYRAATLSSASRIRKPRSFRYGLTPCPRGLLARSASERYLPARNPRASEK